VREGVVAEALELLERVTALGAEVLVGGHQGTFVTAGCGGSGAVRDGDTLALATVDCQAYGTMPTR
jgi:hypothetical protein